MTKTELLPLALAALDAPDASDARIVLADAIEELDWWDPRVIVIFAASATIYATERAQLTRMLVGGTGSGFIASLGIATVLLFGDWVDTSKPGRRTWALADRCTFVSSSTKQYWAGARRAELTVRRVQGHDAIDIAAADIASLSWCRAHRTLDAVFERFRYRRVVEAELATVAAELATELGRLRPLDDIRVRVI